MSFITKLWRNEEESKTTPISAEALIDLETRLAAYTDTEVSERVKGPASAIEAHLPVFSGTSGKILVDSGWIHGVDGTFTNNSDGVLPSEKAIKTYVDAGLATKQASLGFTAENVANKSTTTTLGASDTLYPSQKAVKTYADTVKGLIVAFNVKDSTYGAKGDGSTDDATAIQSAINAASTAGGGTVFFPAGTYIVGTTIKVKSNVTLQGVRAASVLKLKNTTNVNVLTVEGYGTTGADNYTVRDLAIDGNKANNLTAGMGFASDGRRIRVERLYIYNCREDGFNHKQTAADINASEGGQDSMAIDVWCWNNTRHGLYINSHDFVLIGCQAIGNTKSGVFIDTLGFACVLTNVHVWGLQEFGFNFLASFDAVNCQSEGASSAMVRCVAGGRWTGGRVFVAGTPTNVPGFEIVENGSRVMISNVEGSNFGTAAMFKFTNASAGSGSQISATNNETGLTVSGTPSGNIKWDIRLRGGATYGAAFVTPTEASATEMEFENLSACKVSGTAEIKKIKASQPGQVLTLIFTSTAKPVDGENLKLKVSEAMTADDTLQLVCDGTNWYEIARSAN